MTSNEIRQVIGLKPSSDPQADELRNKNLSKPSEGASSESQKPPDIDVEDKTLEENK